MATSCLCRIEGTQLILASPMPRPNFEGLEIVAPSMLIKFLSLVDLHFHCFVFSLSKRENYGVGLTMDLLCSKISM